MAGVGERARNAHRVLKLRQMGLEEASLESLIAGVEDDDPEDGAEQSIGGGSQHPAIRTIRALKRSAQDGSKDDIEELLEMSNDELEEDWRSNTAAYNEEIDPEGMQVAFESQDRDLAEAAEKPRKAEDMTDNEEESENG